MNEVAKPTAGDGQVVVEVHAAGVNPFDWKVRAGLMKEMFSLKFPATLGGDVAGVVTEVGAGVTNLSVGDEVYGSASPTSGAGSFAEYTATAADQLASKPATLTFTEAGALPLAGVSAYQALVEHLTVSEGQKVLIHGGAGGIGAIAIQIAKHLGAYVATTVSTDDREFVTRLGADEVIDYRTESFVEKLADYDAVFDTVGGEVTKQSLKVLKAGGKLVSMVLYGPLKEAESYNVGVTSVSSRATTERLQKLAELVEQGVVKVTVAKTFPLEQAGEALTYLQEGHPTGKVVVTVKK